MTASEPDRQMITQATITELRERVAAAPTDLDAHLELADFFADGAYEPHRAPLPDAVSEPITLLRRSVLLATEQRPALVPEILLRLGETLLRRYEHGSPGDTADDLDEAIDCLTTALEHADRDATDLAAIGYANRTLPESAEAGPIRPELLYRLGVDHARRSDLGGDSAADDRDLSIGYLREFRGLADDDDPRRPEVAAWLGLALTVRVVDRPDRATEEDIADAIAELALARRELDEIADVADIGDARDRETGPEPVIELDSPSDTWRRLRHDFTYRLGTIHAVCYLCRGGSQEDHASAVHELEILAADPGVAIAQADACHLILATLAGLFDTPAVMRTTPVAPQEWAAHIQILAGREPIPNRGDPATIRRHLDSISDSGKMNTVLAEYLGVLRLMTLTERDTDSASAAEFESIGAILDQMKADPDFEPIARETGLVRDAVRFLAARRSGDAVGTAQATELIMDAVAGVDDDHPMRPSHQNLLVALAGVLDPASARPDDVATIERILAELSPNQPEYPTVLARKGIALFAALAVERSAVSLNEVREVFRQVLAHPRAGAELRTVAQYFLGQVDGLQGMAEHDLGLVDSGLRQALRAANLAPENSLARDLSGAVIAGLLFIRGQLAEDQQYLDAARFFGDMSATAPATEDPASKTARDQVRTVTRQLAAAARVATVWHTPSAGGFAELSKAMAGTDGLDDQLRGLTRGGLATARVMEQFVAFLNAAPDNAPVDAGVLRATVQDVVAEANQSSPDAVGHGLDQLSAGYALVTQGIALRDMGALDRGITLLGVARARPDLGAVERMFAVSGLGGALHLRYEFRRRHRDLDNAIDQLEHARLLLGQGDATSGLASVLHELGTCYHLRANQHLGDRRRAVDRGLAALHERANDVLLQNDVQRAQNVAAAAAGEAAAVARWCLDDNAGEQAVRALELGRAIVLHYATIDASIPGLLREGGHQDLAREWVRQTEDARRNPLPWDLGDDSRGLAWRAAALDRFTADPGGLALPTDLRHRVLRAIEGSQAHQRLLSPPTIAEVAAALEANGSDALVYLVPGERLGPGLAVFVYADGVVDHRELPDLRCEPGTAFDAYVRAQRKLHAAKPRSAEADEARQQWMSRLAGVCDWAWTAAMGDTLTTIARHRCGRVTRVVLAPVGELGAVPWHAAARAARGRRRHLCQDIIVSYTASGRQLADTSRRPHRPWDSAAAVVRVDGDGLFWASEETEEIHRCFYPTGDYLGSPDGSGRTVTAQAVLGLLPGARSAGASLLHLGCHANLDPRPTNSHLALSGRSTLRVREILEQARDRPADAAGGLVVLAACASDLTDSVHDEALTLATAFIAAGSVGAVGARWAVADVPTALFMVMFHHYLNRGYDDPATALRATQRWMLDPDRTLPKGIGHRLADELDRHDLAEPSAWAAFTYQGH